MNDPNEKGPKLRLVRGKYKGKTAWVNPLIKETERTVWVIIHMDDGSFLETFVRQTSIGLPLSAPKSYEEALLQQHSKILTMMEELAKQLAMCTIQAGNQPIHAIFDDMIGKYAKMQRDDNENALWKVVTYKAKSL
jgi:hypothetical protein